jgi:hypothetical protein
MRRSEHNLRRDVREPSSSRTGRPVRATSSPVVVSEQIRQPVPFGLSLGARGMTSGCFSAYLEEVANRLPPQVKRLLLGNLNLTLRDWYTDRVPAPEAAQRLKRALQLGTD